MGQIVESTDPKQAAIPHQRRWVKLRTSRSIEPRKLFVFTDGSSLGSYAAVLVTDEAGCLHRFANYSPPTSTRNVGAELNGAIAGLTHASIYSNIPTVLVYDYFGIGAWLTDNWQIKDPEVREKVDTMKSIIATAKLAVSFVHHKGHQRDDSDFTRWNAEADALTTAQMDIVRGIGGIK